MIKFDCRDSVDDCFTSVITHFLKRDHPPPTWADLISALQSPPVDHPHLVSKIKQLASQVTDPKVINRNLCFKQECYLEH